MADSCHCCGKRPPNLKSCTRCWKVKYCDKTCQTGDWEKHKLDCRQAPNQATSVKTAQPSEAVSKPASDVKKDACLYCGKSSPNMKSCTRCWKGNYCDQTCERNDWRQHKFQCQGEPNGPVIFNNPDLERLLSVIWSEFARLQQGDREMEFMLESDTQERYEASRHLYMRCKKNPGHKDFIPVSQLNLNHLPGEWRNQRVLEVIQTQCRLVVKLTVSYTSPKRPDYLRSSNIKCTSVSRFGTGTWIFYPTEIDKTQPCPIKNCSVSRNPHRVSAFIHIITAAHLVYDDLEAEHTTVEFFYDDDNDEDKKSIVKAQGVKTFNVDESGDVSSFYCVIHDREGQAKLKHVMPTDNRNFPVLAPAISPFCFVISHPHGCAKRVTFGQPKNMQSWKAPPIRGEKFKEGAVICGMDDNDIGHRIEHLLDCQFQHTAATCPGSSGAIVVALEKVDGKCIQIFCPHSKYRSELRVGETGGGSLLITT